MKAAIIIASLISCSAFALNNVSKTAFIAANTIKEECLLLNKHQQLQFSFKSSDPVHFNIHYHTGKEVYYPIAEQLTPEFKPTVFSAPETQTYCLMWSNKQGSGVNLSYSIAPVDN